MNVYQVVSEPIQYQEIIDPEIGGPWEEYCIAELVAAPSPGRAKWLAFKSDRECQRWFGNMHDMPKFSVKLVRKDEPWPEGLCSEQEHLWAWGVNKPWLVSEAVLAENFLACWAEAMYCDDEIEMVGR